MDAVVTRSASLRHGINQLLVLVQNVEHYLVEKKVKGGKRVQCSECDYKEDIQK